MVKTFPKTKIKSPPSRIFAQFFPHNKRLEYRKLPEHHLHLSVRKLDGSCFSIHVARNSTVSMLKLAVEKEFWVSFKDEGEKTWSVVWSHFCLCHKGQKLISDKACIQKYGIKDGDQLYFIQHMRIDLAPPTPKQSKNRRAVFKRAQVTKPRCLKELLTCSRFRRPKGKTLEYYSRGQPNESKED